jgi:Fic family protein
MLQEIGEMHRAFHSLPASIQSQLMDDITEVESVAFVLNSNRLELVGTQDEGATRQLCCAAALPGVLTEWQQRETIQTFQALQHMLTIKQEACKEAGAMKHHVLAITPDMIKEVHAVLMAELLDAPGAYRDSSAYPAGYSFRYTEPEKIEDAMLAWTDAINNFVVHSDGISLSQAFNLAALALFHCVDVHPFRDGNGRVCRIVANSLLMLHHFFPVYIQPGTAPDPSHRSWRGIYIGAIEACRADPARVPADLAALLIESSWATWSRITAAATQPRGGE